MKTKSYFGIAIAMLLSGSGLMAQGQSNYAPGAVKNSRGTAEFPFCLNFGLTFFSEDEVHTLSVQRNENIAAGSLRVQTTDLFIPGDQWGATIMARRPNNKSDFGLSDGSVSNYNGVAVVSPFISGNVDISYEAGVDIFPAGMSVEVCYSRPDQGIAPISVQVN